jgi:hypothetical protein
VDLQSEDAESKLSALTLGFVDALLVADGEALEAALTELRQRLAEHDELPDDGAHARRRGWLLALSAFARWGLERLPSPGEIALRADSQAARFLRGLEGGETRTSAQLQQLVGTGDSQISRIGKDLMNHGLVVQRRVGRHAFWELTPRGRQAAQQLANDTASRSDERGGRKHRGGRSHSRSSGAGSTATKSRSTAMLVESAPKRTKRAKVDDPVRTVVRHKDGGWAVAMGDRGRNIERFSTKSDAVRRGKEIVSRAGGGTLHVYDREGKRRTITVRRGA